MAIIFYKKLEKMPSEIEDEKTTYTTPQTPTLPVIPPETKEPEIIKIPVKNLSIQMYMAKIDAILSIIKSEKNLIINTKNKTRLETIKNNVFAIEREIYKLLDELEAPQLFSKINEAKKLISEIEDAISKTQIENQTEKTPAGNEINELISEFETIYLNFEGILKKISEYTLKYDKRTDIEFVNTIKNETNQNIQKFNLLTEKANKFKNETIELYIDKINNLYNKISEKINEIEKQIASSELEKIPVYYPTSSGLPTIPKPYQPVQKEPSKAGFPKELIYVLLVFLALLLFSKIK